MPILGPKLFCLHVSCQCWTVLYLGFNDALAIAISLPSSSNLPSWYIIASVIPIKTYKYSNL